MLPPSISPFFEGFDGSLSSYQALSRKLEPAMAELPEVRVALLASCTIEVAKAFLLVEGARRGLRFTIWSGPYGQIEQQVLDAGSELYAFKPDVVFILARLEDLAGSQMRGFISLDVAGRAELRQSLAKLAQQVALSLRRHSAASMLWSAYVTPRLPGVEGAPGLFGAESLAAFTSSLNVATATEIESVSDARLFDLPAVVARCGTKRWHDERMSFLARMPFSGEGFAALGTCLARAIRALRVPPRKCLVLDLDNPMWGGVLGEAGLGGIKLGDTFPGNAHQALQRAAQGLRNRGVLLAVASKNNREEALNALEHHPDMILRPADFNAIEIHWEDKVTSLRRIAKTLNIGTDALVFVDDNPAEREWVRKLLPEVAVIELPSSVVDYAVAIEHSEWFDAAVVTRDDALRVAMMSRQTERQALQENSGSLEEFLNALQMRTQAGPVNAETIERVVQLLAKTNQFNLTTRRHTRADLERMIAGGAVAVWMRLADKFGDNGLIGVVIGVPETGEGGLWRVDSLLLSCRVIGRGIETALLGLLAKQAFARGGRVLTGEFLPSERNQQTKDLYARHGFEPKDSAGQFWTKALEPLENFPIPAYLDLTYDD
ncbi:MAG: HAD-IIIC family phosphatase [Verrucomicrobia bacterium]|nr:HAD-IIIC family phosphatase [Verrucomicrobiota bacterium]